MARRFSVLMLALGVVAGFVAGCGGGGKATDGGSDGKRADAGTDQAAGEPDGGTDTPLSPGGPDAASQTDAGDALDAVFKSDAAAGFDLTGTWTIVCCNDVYHGFVMLTQVGTAFTGTYTDTTVGTGGAIVGAIHGSQVEFTRTTDSINQDYSLTVSDDGNAMTGTLSGSHDLSVGVDVEMSRDLSDAGVGVDSSGGGDAGVDSAVGDDSAVSEVGVDSAVSEVGVDSAVGEVGDDSAAGQISEAGP